MSTNTEPWDEQERRRKAFAEMAERHIEMSPEGRKKYEADYAALHDLERVLGITTEFEPPVDTAGEPRLIGIGNKYPYEGVPIYTSTEISDAPDKPVWPRVRDLPEIEQDAFRAVLVGQTMPYVEGIPDSEQDFYYPWDYERWKRKSPIWD